MRLTYKDAPFRVVTLNLSKRKVRRGVRRNIFVLKIPYKYYRDILTRLNKTYLVQEFIGAVIHFFLLKLKTFGTRYRKVQSCVAQLKFSIALRKDCHELRAEKNMSDTDI